MFLMQSVLILQLIITKFLDYYKNLSATIPDDYLKHVFAKYVVFKENVGEYIPPTILEGDIICQTLFRPDGKAKT